MFKRSLFLFRKAPLRDYNFPLLQSTDFLLASTTIHQFPLSKNFDRDRIHPDVLLARAMALLLEKQVLGLVFSVRVDRCRFDGTAPNGSKISATRFVSCVSIGAFCNSPGARQPIQGTSEIP